MNCHFEDAELSFCEARAEVVAGATDRTGRVSLRDLPVGPGGLLEGREEDSEVPARPGVCVHRNCGELSRSRSGTENEMMDLLVRQTYCGEGSREHLL